MTHCPDAAAELVRELPSSNVAEVWPGENDGSLVHIGINAAVSPRRLGRFYSGLVKLADAHGWRLHDPQVGIEVSLEVPGKYPPGWVLPLTNREIHKLADASHYEELGQQLQRIRGLNKRNKYDLTPLEVVLYSRIEGASVHTGGARWRALQALAIQMIQMGTDPLQRSKKSGRTALLSAVKTDNSEVVSYILTGLSTEEQQQVLSERWERDTLSQHAERVQGLFSDRTAKLLKRVEAKLARAKRPRRGK